MDSQSVDDRGIGFDQKALPKASDIETEEDHNERKKQDCADGQASIRDWYPGKRNGLAVRNCFLNANGALDRSRRTDKAVAPLRMGLDESGLLGGIAQRIAQPLDGVVQTLFKIDKGIGGPDLALQLFASDQLSWMFQKDLKDAKRLVLKSDPGTVLANLAVAKIHLEPWSRFRKRRTKS
jgi:hypothetical protein